MSYDRRTQTGNTVPVLCYPPRSHLPTLGGVKATPDAVVAAVGQSEVQALQPHRAIVADRLRQSSQSLVARGARDTKREPGLRITNTAQSQSQVEHWKASFPFVV